MDQQYDHLIIGGGMTGDAAARALREYDAEASVAVLGEEVDAPYQRPPLTKDLWNSDDASPESVDLGTASRGANVFTGHRAVSLDPETQCVTDDQGQSWGYEHLLLATGSTPRRLPLPEHARVIHYRTLADYRALRAQIGDGTRVAVVGSGFIGCELAAALNGADCEVTMVFPEMDIGAVRFPDSLADFLTGYYHNKGVAMRTQVTVTGGEAGDDGVTLALSDGSELAVDGVVAGLGVQPNVALAEQAGLDVTDGIVVDEHLRTGMPNIWAAGDVANFHNPALDQRLRVEHENAAVGMGHLAGRNMAGANETYTTLPFFYSDLFDLGYEAVGTLDNRLEVFEDWKTPFREGVVYYLDDGRVRGVLLWNVWGQVEAAQELIARPGPIDMESLQGALPRGV